MQKHNSVYIFINARKNNRVVSVVLEKLKNILSTELLIFSNFFVFTKFDNNVILVF